MAIPAEIMNKAERFEKRIGRVSYT
jgi:hypothetical protein